MAARRAFFSALALGPQQMALHRDMTTEALLAGNLVGGVGKDLDDWMVRRELDLLDVLVHLVDDGEVVVHDLVGDGVQHGRRAERELVGRRLEDDVELMPISPAMRFNWPEGAAFDYFSDGTAMLHELARTMPEEVSGYEEYARYSAHVLKDGMLPLGKLPQMDIAATLRALPPQRAWKTLAEVRRRGINNRRTRAIVRATRPRPCAFGAGAMPFEAGHPLICLHG